MPTLLVDNGSLYTPKLHSILGEVGCAMDMLEPGKVGLDSLHVYDSFVLSGRRINDRNTNMVNSKLVAHAIACNAPLLGVCYGAEILALACGGTIRKMKDLRQGLHTIRPTGKNALCTDKMSVYESHRYEISTLPDAILPVASSAECANELICVRGAPIYGTQFHPEMSDDGRRILAEFARRHLGATRP